MPVSGKAVGSNQRRSFPLSHNGAKARRAAHTTVSKGDAIVSPDPEITEEIAVDAAQHLLVQSEYKILPSSDTKEHITFLQKYISDKSKLSREQHIARFVDAYALYAHMRNDERLQRAVLEAAKGVGRHPNGRTTSLRLVLELMISYGDDGNEEEKRRAGKLYSRDVAAVTNLIRRGVTPTQVKALSRKKGEGLYCWATWRPEAISVEDDLSNSQTPTAGLESNNSKSLIRDRLTPTAPADMTSDVELGQDETVSTPASRRMGMNFPKSWPNELTLSKVLPNGKRMMMGRTKLDDLSKQEIIEWIASYSHK